MNNINTLRSELSNVFEELRANKIGVLEAKEINNTAGKIIGTIKVELEYAKLKKVEPDIKFLNVAR